MMDDVGYNTSDRNNEIINGYSTETVLVTGFGPFSIHKTNASWEAVKELELLGLGDKYRLQVERLDVIYEEIDRRVPELWKKYKPKLVVHCGVSGIAKDVTLEQRGHRKGYECKDVMGKTPNDKICCCSDKEAIDSSLQMKFVCDCIKSSDCGVTAIVSQDAGRYLCDYTYFTSLSIDCSRTAFIHVPPLDQPFTAKQLAEAIKIAILAMLKQLESN